MQDTERKSRSRVPGSIDDAQRLLSGVDYICGRALATVTFLALRLPRPLFLEGEAGVGKTAIAQSLATALGRRLIRLQCYEGLDSGSAVYEWNFAAQMIAIRTAEAAGQTDRVSLTAELFGPEFLVERPLLEAMRPRPEGPPVLLIDEIDRTDEPFEAFLLEALSDFQGDHSRDRNGRGRGPSDRGSDLESNPGSSRCPETPMPVPLGRFS